MSISQIAVIAVSAIIVIGFTIFLIKRSNLLNAKVQHGIDSETGTVVENVVAKASESINRVADTVGKLGSGVENIIVPLSSGIGAILHSIADRIKVKQDEFNQLKSQSIALAQEIERLKSRQINITEVTSQLKMALISMRQQYTSLKRTNIESL